MKKIIILMILLWFSCAAYAFEGLSDVTIHGFISQGYLSTTENDFFLSKTKDGTFQFNEIGLNFGTTLTDSLRISIQFIAKDLGILGNDEVTLDYAMADYNYRDWFGIRVGKVKTAYGLYNQTRDLDMGRLNIFLPQSLYHEAYRDQQLANKGVSLYGRLFEQLDYNASVGIIDIDVDSGIPMYMNYQLQTVISDIDADPNVYFNVLWNTPLEGLSLGGTYTTFNMILYTPETSTDPNIVPYGEMEYSGNIVLGSLEFLYRNLTFSTEYLKYPLETSFTTLYDMGGDVIVPVTVTMKTNAEGYYAKAGYRLTDWFEFGGGYSAFYQDIDDRDDPRGYLKDVFLSVRFDLNDYWIIKLEGHSMDGLHSVIVPVTETDPEENWYMFAVKATYSF